MYLLVNYTIARKFVDSVQLFIWLGLVPAVLGNFSLFLRKGPIVNAELRVFSVFLFWSLLSAVVAANFDEKYLRFLVQFLIVSYLVSETVFRLKVVRPYFWAFWFIGLYNSIELLSFFNWNLAHLLFNSGRQTGLFTSENLLGLYCALGVMGGLSLAGFSLNPLVRIMIAVTTPLSLIGVIASGSRGGILLVVFFILWWTLVIMRKRLSNIFTWLFLLLIIFYAGFIAFNKLMSGTVIEERISNTDLGGDTGKGEARWYLIEKGWELGFSYPVFGVSFGGFRKLSGTGFDYAHNDIADVVASTGLFGLYLYLLLHWIVFKRFKLNFKFERDKERVYLNHLGLMLLLSIFLSAVVFRPNFTALDIWISFGLVSGISRITPRLI